MPHGAELDADREAHCSSSCQPAPLTTVFTPPASCADNWTPVASSTTSGLRVSLTRNTTAHACAPTQWVSYCASSCADAFDLSNISPGVCPEGAPAAGTGIVDGVTTHYCCPFTNATHSSGTCFQTFSGVKTFTYNTTAYMETASWVTWRPLSSDATTTQRSLTSWNTSSVTTTAETVFVKLGTLEAEPFIVRFRKADFQSNSTASTPATNESSATPSEAATTDQALSTGTKAGIGVGVTLGVLLLIAIGLGVFWLRKKKNKRADEKAMGTPVRILEGQEVQASGELPAERSTAEMDGAYATSELPVRLSAAEMNAQPTSPRELQASRYREVNSDDPAELGGGSWSGR